MASTDSRPVPIKNTAYRIYFGIYKNDGTLISSAAGLDSEVSKDGAAFADCTNEATEVSQGVYYLDLTSTEMNADNVAVVVKTSSTGAVVPTFSICPQETGDIKVDVQSYGGTAGTFASGRPEVNTTHVGGTSQTARDIGASVLLSSGTGTGQVSLSSGVVQADVAKINGQTATAAAGVTFPSSIASPTNITAGTITTVTNLTNAPTAGDFTATMKTSIGTAVAASAVASVTGNVGGNVVGSVGSVTGAVGSVTGAVGSVTGNVGGNVTGSVGSVAAGGITASSIAADAIGASELAADAVTEIAAGILAATVEGSTTVVQSLRLANAALGGKASGLATATAVYRDTGDSKDRITATVDANGNRSAVTLDLT